jgi:glycosyltransferase involved in cell wall biosynthesis
VAPAEIRFRPLDRRMWYVTYTTWLDNRKQLAWARAAAAIGAGVVRPGVHRALVSCGPWQLSNHEAGRRVAERSGLPFVMDLRDPWSLRRRVSEGAATPLFFALADRQERRCVERASLVVVNAEPVREAMAAKYPGARARFLTVTNGYDEEPVPPTRFGERFVLAYAGGIYLDRDPRLLFRAAARVVRELGLSPRDFGVELIGNVDDYGGVPIAAMAREEGLDGYVTTGPARPRREALEFLAGGTMLVSLPQDSPWAIPSKVFEYMLYDAWLLVLADAGSPTEMLLRGSEADVVPTRDVDAMAAVLRERVLAYRRGERPERLAREARFSRRHQAAVLLDAIAAVAGAPAAPRAGAPRAAAVPPRRAPRGARPGHAPDDARRDPRRRARRRVPARRRLRVAGAAAARRRDHLRPAQRRRRRDTARRERPLPPHRGERVPGLRGPHRRRARRRAALGAGGARVARAAGARARGAHLRRRLRRRLRARPPDPPRARPPGDGVRRRRGAGRPRRLLVGPPRARRRGAA